MRRKRRAAFLKRIYGCLLLAVPLAGWPAAVLGEERRAIGQEKTAIGQEVAIPRHLQNGDEFKVSIRELIAFGRKLFLARWTVQEGAGRPLTKGTGAPLSDPGERLIFPRNFNRISGPDTNSCAGCHNMPTVGGGGDIVANVFVLG